MRIRVSFLALASAAFQLLLAASANAQAARFVGAAATCTKSGCHQEQKRWSELEEQAPNRHKDAFEQLTRDPAKSLKYAASIGLADPQSPMGRCIECHAPRNARFFREGVSCEVCHGAGSRYETPHDDTPYMTVGYVKAQALGMPPFINNPKEWVQRCVSCHVMAEQKLIDAGHPSGGCLAGSRSREDQKRCDAEDFDLGIKYKIVSSPNGNHWKTMYDARLNEIKSLAKQFGDPIKMARTKAAAMPTPPLTPPAPVLPEIQPIPTPPPTPPVTAPPPTPPVTAPPPTPPVTAPPPTPPVTAPPPTPPVTAPPPTPPVTAPPPTPPVAAPLANAPPPIVTIAGLPRSPAALVAAVQGRAIELLNSLLTRNVVVPARIRPADPIQYNGPDAELLRLQREALALALEALGTAANSPPGSQK